MKILVVSDREYKKTSRGIDVITAFLADKGHYVDHLVFFRRKKYQKTQVTANICQYFLYDSIKLYRGKLQFLFPGFLLLAYFHHIINKNSPVEFNKYDYVVLESGHPVYLASEINVKIIYRQSDPTHISFNSNRKFYTNLEKKVMEKSLFVTSALDSKYYPPNLKEKIFYWHSGFVPCIKTVNQNTEKSFIILGGELDWGLINKMAKKHPEYIFNFIGIPVKRLTIKNIIFRGYLDFNRYQEIVSSALITIIPFSGNYVRQLRQVSFTAKILASMQLGIPILLRNYGVIQKSDPEKKLFTYNSRKEALSLLDEIIDKIESGGLNNEVSVNTLNFLSPQTAENRIIELENIFSRFLQNPS